MRPNLLQFFQAVLPEQGVFAAVTRNKVDFKFKHKLFNSVEELFVYSRDQLNTNQDLYFALASFKEGWHTVVTPKGERSEFRTAGNVARVRSLWLDVDVGEGKPYKTTREAVEALRNFMIETKLPAPWVINSGSGGLHIYWTFTTSVTRQMWQVVADKLQAAAVAHKFSVDPARTKDSASILRVPASNNCKLDEPRKVKLLAWGTANDFTVYEALLKDYVAQTKPNPDISNILDAIQGLDLGAAATVVPTPEPQYKVRKAEDVIAQCKQLQLQADAPEPVWRGMLATIRHCELGTQFAHKLSAQHPDYNIDITFEKLEQLEEKDIPPYTCAKFKELRPEVCNACPHNGMINSPISVPESRIETVMVEDTGEVVKQQLADVPEIKSYDLPKYRVNETGCFAYIDNGDGGFWVKIYDYPVVPIQRVVDRTPNGDLCVSYIIRRYSDKGYNDFQIGGDILMSTQSAIAALGKAGFLIVERNRKHMANLLVELLSHVQETMPETKVANSLGWDTHHTSFLLGNKVYKTGGEVIDVTPRGNASRYSELTQAIGDLDHWKKIANVYNHKGLEWAQVVVASAFASPLMGIGSLERAALIFVTGDKGIGKSTVLQVATSVYGNPQELVINKDDTPLARLAKLGMLNSITASFDEMTDLSPREASELAYQITQGRGKDRMADMGKGLQSNSTYWSCLPIMSANDSIMASLAQHSADATAQMSRVLEIKATDTNAGLSPTQIAENQRLLRTIPRNYGTAGDVFIRYVTKNYEKVEKLIADVEDMWLKETKLTNSYRFWTFMAVRLIAGAMLAKKLKLIDYDIAGLFQYLKRLVILSKTKLQRYELKPDSLLADFLNSHMGNQLIVKSAKRSDDIADDPNLGALNDHSYVVKPTAQGHDLNVRIERDTMTAYISRKAIRDWCARNRVSSDTFMESLKAQGVVECENSRVLLGKGTVHRDSGRTTCIKLRLPNDIELETE